MKEQHPPYWILLRKPAREVVRLRERILASIGRGCGCFLGDSHVAIPGFGGIATDQSTQRPLDTLVIVPADAPATGRSTPSRARSSQCPGRPASIFIRMKKPSTAASSGLRPSAPVECVRLLSLQMRIHSGRRCNGGHGRNAPATAPRS